jgi:demethylmenaquinone methyltransferase/2-methoxy-6-polyprenyl-1,4-benzoquinol methylase
MLEYYDQRADEYDQWYLRQGRYDTPELNDAWRDDVRWLDGVVDAFAARHAGRRVLELACGTGSWTERTAGGCRLVATDHSPQMLGHARRRLSRAGVTARWARADAYRLPFERASFDAAYAGFFISHVPLSYVPTLFDQMRRVLRPGGELLLFDGRRASCAAGSAPAAGENLVQQRPLNDGRVFSVLKIYYDRERLGGLLSRYGTNVQVQESKVFFVAGSCRFGD